MSGETNWVIKEKIKLSNTIGNKNKEKKSNQIK